MTINNLTKNTFHKVWKYEEKFHVKKVFDDMQRDTMESSEQIRFWKYYRTSCNEAREKSIILSFVWLAFRQDDMKDCNRFATTIFVKSTLSKKLQSKIKLRYHLRKWSIILSKDHKFLHTYTEYVSRFSNYPSTCCTWTLIIGEIISPTYEIKTNGQILTIRDLFTYTQIIITYTIYRRSPMIENHFRLQLLVLDTDHKK